MARTKGSKNKSDSIEITKDLVPEVKPDVIAPNSVKHIDISSKYPFDEIKSLFSSNEKKILEIAEDSKRQNKAVLDKLDDKYYGGKTEIKVLDKKPVISKKHLLFLLFLITVFVVYYKRDFLYAKFMYFLALRDLKKDKKD